MLQIKTIRNRLDNPTLFDDEVNAALRDGWTLKRRTVLRPIGQSESVYPNVLWTHQADMLASHVAGV